MRAAASGALLGPVLGAVLGAVLAAAAAVALAAPARAAAQDAGSPSLAPAEGAPAGEVATGPVAPPEGADDSEERPAADAGAAAASEAEGPTAAPRSPHAPLGSGADGVLSPPRAIAAPPRRPRWPADLHRRTSLGVNLLGLVPGPEEGSSGTWRVEGVVERAFRPRLSWAVIASGGRVLDDGFDGAFTLGISGQYRGYLRGRFDGGLYLAGTLGFWSIDPYIAWSLGGGVGYKRILAGGFTIDLLAGLQLPVDWFRHGERGNPPELEDAWRALLPGPLVSIGGSFDARPRARRGR